MKIDKYTELKKQDWYDHDWAMTPYLWELLEGVYNMDKTIKEIHEICWGDKNETLEKQR